MDSELTKVIYPAVLRSSVTNQLLGELIGMLGDAGLLDDQKLKDLLVRVLRAASEDPEEIKKAAE